MADHRHETPVAMMCRLLHIKPSGFYAWLRRPESQRSQENRRLKNHISSIHAESEGVYGSLRIRDELLALGFPLGKHRVARLMQNLGLKGCSKKRYRVTTMSDHGFRIAPNNLDREFSADRPNQRWAADITYIKTGEGWLFLAVVMGLYSKAIVSWSMSSRITREIVLNAFMMALAARKPGAGLPHHSDRGSQYVSGDFQSLLEANAIESSMSGAGNCYDNAVVESWFGLLKRERVNRRRYRSRAEARRDVFDYIERFYNRRRPYGSAGRMSPLK